MDEIREMLDVEKLCAAKANKDEGTAIKHWQDDCLAGSW